ncbi:Glycoprotein-N-acetylgalactosamine 3-beta-galactosyltransferase 1 [Schistosoma japonicum]|nr:Glycoprotein-N-acetylgalactosamine 3-beta-galactosyltransferase 1 [Schistosoma japonicum]KAH8870528.1 Glycoprotein-N-acetylgalactosamine 3-beta-galactosyltransferase 1 [Schistosoma japonicum]KAH8870529.1 Glycoprotein-N-acetylgalactosamine 3-beta-galactosyltransferase 1 [Schistosoma japonicum]
MHTFRIVELCMKILQCQNGSEVYPKCRVVCCLLFGMLTGLIIVFNTELFRKQFNYQLPCSHYNNRKYYSSDKLTEFILKNIVDNKDNTNNNNSGTNCNYDCNISVVNTQVNNNILTSRDSLDINTQLNIHKLKLAYPEERRYLWNKISTALRYIYQFRDDYDYFLKADDDTYVIMENLLDALQHYSPDMPFMLGHRFPTIVQNGFFSGGAGYILSREALKNIVEKSIDKHPNCSIYDEIGEDVMMSICGQAVGVRLFDVHDILNRDRFQYDSPDAFLNFKSYLKLNWRPVELDSNFSYAAPHQSLLSDVGITFHYVTPEMMYMLEYFSYYLRPIGLVNDFVQLPDSLCNEQ